MILTLEITKIGAGQFSAQIHNSSGPIEAPQTYGRLTSAIESAIFMRSAQFAFLEVRYDRISSGTLQMKDLKPLAARDIAIRMMAMHTYLAAQESDSAWGTDSNDMEFVSGT